VLTHPIEAEGPHLFHSALGAITVLGGPAATAGDAWRSTLGRHPLRHDHHPVIQVEVPEAGDAELTDEDLLVEDVSIDGMCGVY
jgi:mycofactocin precursor